MRRAAALVGTSTSGPPRGPPKQRKAAHVHAHKVASSNTWARGALTTDAPAAYTSEHCSVGC